MSDETVPVIVVVGERTALKPARTVEHRCGQFITVTVHFFLWGNGGVYGPDCEK
jgi:hypothetical protein